MLMIPEKMEKNNSDAELKVFHQLKEALDDKTICLHSVNLLHHEYKREAEADFVILHESCILVLEVKGGIIKTENGQWFTKDRHQKIHKIFSPFEQARTAMYALLTKLKNTELLKNNYFSIGYAVVFPDSNWKSAISSEWEREMICDISKMKNFENWLINLISFWKKKPSNYKKTYTHEELHIIKESLRSNYQEIPLLLVMDNLEKESFNITKDQYNIIDAVIDNPRFMCYSTAGTGEVFMAIECSLAKASKGHLVALICVSKNLSFYIQSLLHNSNVFVCTVDSISNVMKNNFILAFDSVIVIEAQEISKAIHVEKINNILIGGLSNGHWGFFYDKNYKSVDSELLFLDFIEGFNPVKVKLKRNCRNTSQIIDYIYKKTCADVGEKVIGDGFPIKEYEITNLLDFHNTIVKIFDSFEKDNISKSDVTFLSKKDLWETPFNSLFLDIGIKLIEVDNYVAKNFPPNSISYSSINEFKGMENKIIIYFRDKNDISINKKYEDYVAITRARFLLIVINC